MKARAGWIGLMIMTSLVALPLPTWAGSAQAALGVGAVVAARCAVRTPGSLAAGDVPATPSDDPVSMRCTKGSPPSATGVSSPAAARPRVSRDLILSAAGAVLPPAGAPMGAPRPLTDAGVAGPAANGPRLVITVNF